MKQFKYIICAIIGLLLAISTDATAQNRWVLKGTVLDAEEWPVAGASVRLMTSGGRNVTGVATDMDGNFMIEITVKDPVLNITCVGYKAQVVKIQPGETTKNIVMEADVKTLSEVVITEKAPQKSNDGYMPIAKRNLAASTTQVNLENIAKSPATSVSEMMQGRAAGVQIVANSGDPGAPMTIRIRGNASINGSNDPLIVIDGVPYDIDLNGANVSDLTSSHSPLSMVNPADIASIDILKDAASCAIYGAKGANGVVVITTKRGSKNEKVVNFNTSFTLRQAPTEIPLLSGDHQKTFILEGDQHARNDLNNWNSSNMDNLSYPMLRDDANRKDFYYYNNNTDWVDLVTKTGYQWDTNFALRGGGNTTRYSFSVGYTTDHGTTIGSSYNRFTSNFNLDYNIANNLVFKTTIGYVRENRGRNGALDKIYNDDGSDNINPLGVARAYPAFLAVYEKDGLGNDLDSYYLPRPEHDNTIYSKYYYNPLAWTKYTQREIVNNNFRSNVAIEWNIWKGLSLTSRVAVDFTNNGDRKFIPSEATNRDWNDQYVNYTYKSNDNSQMINQENILTYAYSDPDEKHSVSAMVLSKVRYDSNGSIDMSATNTGSPNADGMDASNRWRGLGAGKGRNASAEIIGQVHYMLLDRYIIQGTVNRTGSTKFGKSERWGTFPTVAVAYRLSGEPFMTTLREMFLSNLKLRYSYGDAGREPGDAYTFVNTYSQAGSYLGEYGIASNNIELTTLKWETTTTNNYAVDLGLFDDRVQVTFEYYDRLTKDLLTKRPVPGSIGYGDYAAYGILTNFGELSNKGYEVEFDASILEGSFKWSVYGNIGINRNKVTYWPEDQIQNVDGDITWAAGHNDGQRYGYPALVREGDPLGAFYGFKFKGVYANDADAVARDANGNVIVGLNGEPKKITWEKNSYTFTGGDAIYEDLNHDGIINTRDRTIIGDANPDFYGGIGTKFSWKNWRLDMFFQYQVGNDIINQARKDLEAQGGGTNANSNQAQSVMRRWRKQGDVTDIPRAVFTSNYNNAGSDKYVEDGSYVRLKSLALTYDVPSSFCKKIGMRSAAVSFNAYNLLTFTGYKGQDPEISIGGGIGSMGVDNNRTAVPRSYTMSLALTF